jgi:Predicted phosphohydrolases
MTIAHISDLHFGRIADSGVVEALLDEINAAGIDLVAVSGDLTQRARPAEYRAARNLLDALGPPTLVVAGNHDVYPWWRPLKRLRTPLERYKQFITEDLAPTFEAGGVAALGLTSAYGPSIKGGRIGPADRAAMRAFFSETGDDRFKVLVVHHQLHPTAIGPISPHPVARQAQQTLAVAGEVGIDLILCGHLHISAIQPLEIIPGPRASSLPARARRRAIAGANRRAQSTSTTSSPWSRRPSPSRNGGTCPTRAASSATA